MTKIICIISLLINYSLNAQVENQVDSKVLNSIEDVSFMKGTWKGEGWIFKNREKKEFIQTETIAPKVDNSILVIDGIGFAKDSISVTTQVIHNAFGVISFNKEKNMMTMLSYSSTGGKMENEIKLLGDKKLQWSFKDERGGTIRFILDFSEEGIWSENGDYSFDGSQWFPFFHMTLYKQAD